MVENSDIALRNWLNELLSEPAQAARERARTTFDREIEGFNNRFVLLGAGNMGRRILARLRKDGLSPLAFADNQPAQWGKTIDGLPVLPPQEAAALYAQDTVFVVTIYNNEHGFPDTRDRLAELGCVKIMSVIPVRWKYPEEFLPYYRDDLPHKVLLQSEEIRAAFALWSDMPSRHEFTAQIAWRLHGDFEALGKPDPDGEYFPNGLIRPRSDELFVDVGAYDGDSIRRFLGKYGEAYSRIIALEPDSQNYRGLLQRISDMPARHAERIEMHRSAASDRAGRLRFKDGDGLAAALSDQGSIEVETVRLDDLLEGRHPTYIKMDIEGAEIAAIEGCRRTISNERPVLAVCVYHAQDHLWNIPLAINKLCASYRFFLRPHMQECWDTVCYAVPSDRVL